MLAVFRNIFQTLSIGKYLGKNKIANNSNIDEAKLTFIEKYQIVGIGFSFNQAIIGLKKPVLLL